MLFSTRLTALIAALVVAVSLPAVFSLASSPSGVTCPEGWTYLENQGWWSEPGQAHPDHIHAGACFPLYLTVSGNLTLNVRTVVHNPGVRPAEFERVSIQSNNNASGGVKNLVDIFRRERCTEHLCTYETPVTINTNLLPDGKQTIRVRSFLNFDDGSELFTTGDWFLDVENGKTDHTSSYPPNTGTRGAGWYRTETGKTLGYATVHIRSPVPKTPVSGSWTFRVWSGTDAGSGSLPTRTSVHVDPDFHSNPSDSGLVILNKAGTADQNVTLDTTQLADGVHRLVLRADAAQSVGTRSGLLVVYFETANGTPPPTTTTEPPPTTTTEPPPTTTEPPPPSGDTQPPSQPGNFREPCCADTKTSIPLEWTASTDNVGVVHYELRRNGGAWVNVGGDATAGVVTYTDTGLSCSSGYNYELVAVDAAGNRSTTATTRGTTDGC